MRCPKCYSKNSLVSDSRITQEGSVIRRRRRCGRCQHRFTTYEREIEQEMEIIKRDGRSEMFDRNKLRESIAVACRKRPVCQEQVQRITDSVAEALESISSSPISSLAIGEKVLEHLRQEDEVAYLRFASVFHRFNQPQDFLHMAQSLI